jgi:hypothetical protein
MFASMPQRITLDRARFRSCNTRSLLWGLHTLCGLATTVSADPGGVRSDLTDCGVDARLGATGDEDVSAFCSNARSGSQPDAGCAARHQADFSCRRFTVGFFRSGVKAKLTLLVANQLVVACAADQGVGQAAFFHLITDLRRIRFPWHHAKGPRSDGRRQPG